MAVRSCKVTALSPEIHCWQNETPYVQMVLLLFSLFSAQCANAGLMLFNQRIEVTDLVVDFTWLSHRACRLVARRAFCA